MQQQLINHDQVHKQHNTRQQQRHHHQHPLFASKISMPVLAALLVPCRRSDCLADHRDLPHRCRPQASVAVGSCTAVIVRYELPVVARHNYKRFQARSPTRPPAVPSPFFFFLPSQRGLLWARWRAAKSPPAANNAIVARAAHVVVLVMMRCVVVRTELPVCLHATRSRAPCTSQRNQHRAG
jgi:hypothetical protein